MDACSPSPIVVSGEGDGYFLEREGGVNNLRAGVQIPPVAACSLTIYLPVVIGNGYFRQPNASGCSRVFEYVASSYLPVAKARVTSELEDAGSIPAGVSTP